MAHVFSITDGTNTVQLNSGDYLTTRYAIVSAAPSSGFAAMQPSNGDLALLPFEWANVTESIEILIIATSLATLQADVEAIQRFLDAARLRQQSGAGPKIYLQARLDSSGQEAYTWRSEIVAGQLSLKNAGDQVSLRKMEAVLSVTRRYFWERADEVTVQVTSSVTTTPASSAALYINDDATPAQTNYVHMAASEVTGVLPCPMKLTLTNDDAAGNLNWREFFVTNTVWNDPANFDPFLLGSEATAGGTFSWSTSVEEIAYAWPPTILTNARLTRLGGRYYRLLVALTSATSGVYLRPAVDAYIGGVAVEIWKGARVYYNNEGVLDLGPVPLPPGGYDVAGSSVQLRINAYKAGGGTLVLDFAHLMPAGDGLYRRVVQQGFAITNGGSVTLDGISGLVYAGTTTHTPILRSRGLPVYLWPNVVNRLRLMIRETGWTAGRRILASVVIRPRRLDI